MPFRANRPDDAPAGPPVGSRRATTGSTLFVYYKVAESDLPAVAAAARAVQQALCAEVAGLVAGLSRRPQVRDGLVTVMETYEHPTLSFEAELGARLEPLAAAATAAWRVGDRHQERFVPL